ncbi:MAG UNVERIFIED_CONTAM: hypothetical protein LVR18_32465 [Planctomycetaceae bacterium]
MCCLNSHFPFDCFHLGVGHFFRGWLLVGIVVCSTADFAGADGEEAFEKAIRPLLLDRCIECHGPTKQEHGVRLDRRQDVLQGKAGDQPLIVPGEPARSRIFQVLQHAEDDIAMPPSGRLPEEQRQAVHDWIQAGAALARHGGSGGRSEAASGTLATALGLSAAGTARPFCS